MRDTNIHHLPIIQSIPHAGLAAPPEVAGRLAISETDIYNECDLWAEQLFDFGDVLAQVTTGVARALVDVNRLPDDLDNPDGPVKTQTSYGRQIYTTPLARAEKAALLDRYWRPYHARLQDALRQHAAGVKLLLDCHNMAQHGPTTYAFAGAARPLICLANLGDSQGEPLAPGGRITCPPWLLQRAGALVGELFADMTLLAVGGAPPPVVALNWPFAGGILIDRYATGLGGDGRAARHGQAPYAIMIEVNRGLFVGDQRADTPIAPPNLERIALIRQRLHRWIVGVVDLMQTGDGE